MLQENWSSSLDVSINPPIVGGNTHHGATQEGQLPLFGNYNRAFPLRDFLECFGYTHSLSSPLRLFPYRNLCSGYPTEFMCDVISSAIRFVSWDCEWQFWAWRQKRHAQNRPTQQGANTDCPNSRRLDINMEAMETFTLTWESQVKWLLPLNSIAYHSNQDFP